MSATAQVPPQALDAEESILGALMLMPYDSTTLDLIRETGLTASDFYRESHARIYRTAIELQAEQIQPDAIALTARLEEQGHLDQVGGRERIHELAQTVPATANAPHYAKIVHEMAVWRGLITFGQNAARLGFERVGEPGQALEHARAMLDESANGSSPAAHIRLVTLAEFTSVTDDQAQPLIGTIDDTLLPTDGMLLMYGDGGAGKTTLSIDALAHLAAGQDWLGHPVPTPTRVALIENEGPRGPFRKLLQKKTASWPHAPFAHNVHVLEEPWTQFTLTEPAYRRGLAKELDRVQAQAVIVGPLASLGAKGTGTPDDVNEFTALVNDLRARTTTPFALWIVHHENKAGDVSGAWERLPDTLVHISAQGNGRTRLHWRKARWSSTVHNTSLNLIWSDNSGFTIEQQVDRDLHAELEAWLADNPRSTTNDVVDGVKAKRKTLTNLLEESDRFTYEKGPRNSKLWRLHDDYAQLDLTGSQDAGTSGNQSSKLEAGSSGSDPLPPLRAGVEEPLRSPVVPDSPEPVDTDDERTRWLDA